MPIRETSRVVTISGRRWKINKFDALTGSYIAVKMVSKLSGVMSAFISGKIDIKNKEDQGLIALSLANEIGSLSKTEFNEIQGECLHVVQEVTEVGGKEITGPLRLPDGRWAVSGMEDDALLILGLVSHVLLFNLTSFFDENVLKELGKSFQGLTSFSASESTNSPSPQL